MVSKNNWVMEKPLIYRRNELEIYLKITLDYIKLNEDDFVILAATDSTREVHRAFLRHQS